MPVSLRALKAKTARIQVEYGGENIAVDYFPHKYDDAVHAALQKAEGTKVGDEYILRLVHAWEIEGDDGRMLPVTAEALAELPVLLKLEITQVIQADIADPKATTPSSGGTAPAASSSAPNGPTVSLIGSS